MCGIFGYLGSEKIDEKLVRQMGESLYHRGPDDHGEFIAKGVALGNRRLSIIDLAGGHQPFFSSDNQIVVVQNGEIFNYIELFQDLRAEGVPCETQSDTEVILRLYEQKGIEFLKDLNGMFAIAILDQRTNELFVVRDRLGVKPVYYYHDGKKLFFASEIKAILKAIGPCDVDYEALAVYLQLGYLPPQQTLFKNIFQLEPGHLLHVKEGKVAKRGWWRLADVIPTSGCIDQWREEFLATFANAVKIRMRADVPFGAFLSGGVDSSWIVSQMKMFASQPVQTYSVSFPKTRFDESSEAKHIANQLETEHHSISFDSSDMSLWAKAVYHCDHPHADLSFLSTLKVSELAVRDVKMVLSGDGADELFAGYGRYLAAQQSWSKTDNGSLASDHYERNHIFHYDLLRKLLVDNSVEVRPYHEIYRKQLSDVSDWDPVNKILYLDVMNLLVGNNLVKPDRMGMAVSLEARPPFMDYRLAELAFRVPGHYKLEGGETKSLIKAMSHSAIGKEVAYRPKQMFTVPVTEWQGQGLAKIARRVLLGSKGGAGELFDSNAIESIVTAHEVDPYNNLRELRALISLNIWWRMFIEGEDLQNLAGQLAV